MNPRRIIIGSLAAALWLMAGSFGTGLASDPTIVSGCAARALPGIVNWSRIQAQNVPGSPQGVGNQLEIGACVGGGRLLNVTQVTSIVSGNGAAPRLELLAADQGVAATVSADGQTLTSTMPSVPATGVGGVLAARVRILGGNGLPPSVPVDFTTSITAQSQFPDPTLPPLPPMTLPERFTLNGLDWTPAPPPVAPAPVLPCPLTDRSTSIKLVDRTISRTSLVRNGLRVRFTKCQKELAGAYLLDPRYVGPIARLRRPGAGVGAGILGLSYARGPGPGNASGSSVARIRVNSPKIARRILAKRRSILVLASIGNVNGELVRRVFRVSLREPS